MAKKKLDVATMQQTHGALAPQKSIFDLEGFVANKYNTEDASAYHLSLEKMTVADLQHHAISVAHIRPGYDRNRLVSSLEKRFAEYMFERKLKSRPQ